MEQEESLPQEYQVQKNCKKCLDDFSLIIVVGEGSFAKVVLVRDKATKKVYAMKIIKKKHIKKHNYEKYVTTERNILVSIKHPFIVKLHYSFQTDSKLYFVMEFAQGGELFNLLQIVKQFAENTTRYYAAQIILALEALHEQDIIYRDLKPENVLLDDKGYIKLADFGMSKKGVKGKNDAKSVCGTPEYLAPEILTKQGYGKAVDYWALGSIIYEMLTGFPPFYIPQDQQNKQYDEGQARNDLFMRILNEDLRYPPHLTKLCINFLQGLLEKDPNKRLGAKNGIQEIKNHPWFNQLDWNILINKQYQAPYKPVIKEDDYINLNEQQQYTQTPLDDSLQTASLQSQTDPINFNNFTYSGTQIDENNMDIEG